MSQSAPIFADTVVHIVRFRADGDVSFLGSLARRIISRGGRITNRIAKETTHIIFQEKPCCSAAERAAEEAKLRELFDDKLGKLDSLAKVPHVVSPLWVQESLKLGHLADEQDFAVKRPSAPAIWLHSASTSAADPSASSKQPRRKSASSATATAAALLSNSSVAPAPLASLLMEDVNDTLMFSSSQAIKEAEGSRRVMERKIPNFAIPPPPRWAESGKQKENASERSEKEEEVVGSRKRTREEQPEPCVNIDVTRRRSSQGPSSVSALLSRALSSVVSPPNLLAGGNGGGEARSSKRRTSSNHVTPRTTPLNSPRDPGAIGMIVIPKIKTDQVPVIDLTASAGNGSKNVMPSSSSLAKEEGNDKENSALAQQAHKVREKGNGKMTDFFPLATTKSSSKLSESKSEKVCVAYSSVDAQTIELIKKASKELGLEVCPEGQEERKKITHLIVGPDPKRTIKMLVAISRGCHIVNDEWISDSLTAGKLLEIHDLRHRSSSCYSATSDSVREMRRVQGQKRPLEGTTVFLWPARGDASSSVKERHREGIERVVGLLGGKIASLPSSATCHIMMAGAEGKPLEVTEGIRWLKEEWLLQMAEKQEAVDIIDKSYYVH
jgi:hypothetical protein